MIRSALGPLPVGSRFEARLASRLATTNPVAQLMAAVGEVTRRELRHPGRIVITGALSSAVGLGFTVLAIRRAARRHAVTGQQPAHR